MHRKGSAELKQLCLRGRLCWGGRFWGAGSGALGEARGFKRGKRDPHAAVQRI